MHGYLFFFQNADVVWFQCGFRNVYWIHSPHVCGEVGFFFPTYIHWQLKAALFSLKQVKCCALLTKEWKISESFPGAAVADSFSGCSQRVQRGLSRPGIPTHSIADFNTTRRDKKERNCNNCRLVFKICMTRENTDG